MTSCSIEPPYKESAKSDEKTSQQAQLWDEPLQGRSRRERLQGWKKKNSLVICEKANLCSNCHQSHCDGAEEMQGVRDCQTSQKSIESVGHFRSNQDRDGKTVGK